MMRHSVIMNSAWAVAAMLAPATARANVAFGLALQIGIEFLVLLYPVILLEGHVLSKILRLPYKTARSLVARANLLSAAVGLVVALPLLSAWLRPDSVMYLEPNRDNSFWLIAPLFLPSWLIEGGWMRYREPALRLWLATGAANLLSSALLLVLPGACPKAAGTMAPAPMRSADQPPAIDV